MPLIVALLRVGCKAFQQEAGFNPMEKCFTIASVLCIHVLKMRWREKNQQVLKGGCMVARHPGDGVLQIEVRVSLYKPLEIFGRLDWRPLGNKLEFMDKKTGRYHHFGVDEGRWWCSMSCLGVTGKPMVVTVKCGVEIWLYADRVRTNWCFGTTIFKANALRFTLVMKRKHER